MLATPTCSDKAKLDKRYISLQKAFEKINDDNYSAEFPALAESVHKGICMKKAIRSKILRVVL